MVIAVLAVIWVFALTPMILRKLSERRLTTSVDSFHRQLRGLRRAYPRLAESAAHPDLALSMARTADGGRHLPEAFVSSLSASDVAHPERDRLLPRLSSVSSRPLPQPARRRRVLLGMLGAMLGFFLLGMIPSLRILWDASLLAFAATAAYLALLIHFHRREVEHELKIVDIEDRRGDPRARTAYQATSHEHDDEMWAEERTTRDLSRTSSTRWWPAVAERRGLQVVNGAPLT